MFNNLITRFLYLNIVLLQVRHLDTSEKSELHKLQQLKDEQGLVVLFYERNFYTVHHILNSCYPAWAAN